MEENIRTVRKIIRVGGKLKELLIIKDTEGRILHKVVSPFMVEFNLKDVLQVLVGAAILSIPVSLTEEAWRLGETLPLSNVVILGCLSVLFVGAFVYYNFYKRDIKGNWIHFVKRTIFTYLLSFLVVSVLLTLIQQAPWGFDYLLAVKRVIIVTFPASMSATLADTIK